MTAESHGILRPNHVLTHDVKLEGRTAGSRRQQAEMTSILKHVGRDHELTQGLVLVIYSFARFFQDFPEAVGGSADMF